MFNFTAQTGSPAVMLVWSFLSACNASITILLSNVAKSPYYKIIQLGITSKNTYYNLIQPQTCSYKYISSIIFDKIGKMSKNRLAKKEQPPPGFQRGPHFTTNWAQTCLTLPRRQVAVMLCWYGHSCQHAMPGLLY
jgi:hypothetical protein